MAGIVTIHEAIGTGPRVPKLFGDWYEVRLLQIRPIPYGGLQVLTKSQIVQGLARFEDAGATEHARVAAEIAAGRFRTTKWLSQNVAIATLGYLWLMAALGIVMLVILETRRGLRRVVGRCSECGYELSDATVVCSECGAAAMAPAK